MSGLHQCPNCGYRFESNKDLEDHREACTTEKCRICLTPGCQGGCL